MSDKKPLLSVPGKVDKRAEALKKNLLRRKAATRTQKDKDKKDKE